MGCGKSKTYVEQHAAEGKDPEEIKQDCIKLLREVPIFSTLSDEDLGAIVDKAGNKTYKAKQSVVFQDERGDSFFIILKGSAEVTQELETANDNIIKKKLATLGRGDFFGEKAMLKGDVRAATVTSTSEVEVIQVSKKLFDELDLRAKVQFKKREAVQAEKVDVFAADTRTKVPKSDAETEMIKQAVKTSELSQVMDFTEKQLTEIAEVAGKEEVASGTTVIEFGDAVAEKFYVLASGSVDILVPGDVTTEAGSRKTASKLKLTVVGNKTGPDAFGGLALLYSQPRAASVKATSDCVLWSIQRSHFKAVLMAAAANELNKFMEFMDHVEELKVLPKAEKQSVARALKVRPFEQGHEVIKEGDMGKSLFLVYEGELEAYVGGEKVSDYKAYGFFGERALLQNEPRAATVKVTSQHATLLEIDSGTFASIRSLFQEGGAQESKAHEEFGKIKKGDLKFVGYLGAGGFGFVSLEYLKETDKYYALKGMSKGHLVANGMEDSAIAERDLLLMMDSPFIIKLYNTYKDKQNVYYLLEACLSGDLYGVCNSENLYGNVNCSAYYASVVAESFRHIHSKHVVYRDLKPENVLICDNGEAKLCDLGIAKKVIGRTYTMCGTPEYMAPEVIQNKGHSFSVDWWCYGVFVYELLHSETPFCASGTFATYKNINKGIDKIKWPKQFSEHKSLIQGLCTKNPDKRTPMLAAGLDGMLGAALFKSVDKKALGTPGYTVPWKPKPINPKTCCKGRVDKADVQSLQVPYKDDGRNWDANFGESV